MNASPQRDASLQRGTHQTRETLFYLDCLHWRNKSWAPQPRPLIWGEGQWGLMSQVMKEITVLYLNFECLCTCVIHENIQCACLYMSVQSLLILVSFLFRSEAQCSCGPTAHVHLRRSSNLKDKPSFWRHLWFLLLSLFVNSIMFPLRFW